MHEMTPITYCSLAHTCTHDCLIQQKKGDIYACFDADKSVKAHIHAAIRTYTSTHINTHAHIQAHI